MPAGMFLDRDGVINEVLSKRVQFVNTPEDVYLLNGAGEAIRHFNEMGFKVFIVTNQGGIGLGYMSEADLYAVHDKIRADLAVYGAHIDDIAYCPHKPHEGCACRKPGAQMILTLAEKHHVELAKSYMIGDREVDVEAGRRAGLQTILVGSRTKGKVNADIV